jgi:alkyldihydroxyacetonephosphate synthase
MTTASGQAVARRRKFWGWGYEGDGLTGEELELLAQVVAARFGLDDLRAREPPGISEIALRPPRVEAPASIAAFSSADPWDRAEHTLGKSFPDLVRGLRREYAHPPDLVAYPADEEQLTAVLDWATGARIAVVPYGSSSAGSATAIPVPCRSTCGAWAAWWRSTARRGRR